MDAGSFREAAGPRSQKHQQPRPVRFRLDPQTNQTEAELHLGLVGLEKPETEESVSRSRLDASACTELGASPRPPVPPSLHTSVDEGNASLNTLIKAASSARERALRTGVAAEIDH